MTQGRLFPELEAKKIFYWIHAHSGAIWGVWKVGTTTFWRARSKAYLFPFIKPAIKIETPYADEWEKEYVKRFEKWKLPDTKECFALSPLEASIIFQDAAKRDSGNRKRFEWIAKMYARIWACMARSKPLLFAFIAWQHLMLEGEYEKAVSCWAKSKRLWQKKTS